ncbi:MAG: class I SAM-dependent methyltransferase [Thermoplasmatales archaeon]|nr:class I SAM-dependent methyltransferase [Thermoplasmatales archaeon]
MDGYDAHWDRVYWGNRAYFGEGPSGFGVECCRIFRDMGVGAVLELGPGQGRDAKHFADNGMSVVGIDFSEVCNAQVRDMIPGVRVYCADIREGFDIPEGPFDACYSHMLFTMDFTDEELLRAKESVFGAVRPGGIVAFSVRNQDDQGFRVGEHMHGDVWKNKMGFRVRFFSKDGLRILTDGFESVRVWEFFEEKKRLYGVTMVRPR